MTEFLFDLEAVTADGQRREIESAKQWARRALLSDPSAPIVVNFSFGKDSLLTALIVAETLDELNDQRQITLSFYHSGAEKRTFQNWFDYVRGNISKRFKFCIIQPAASFSFLVCLLGRGRVPILGKFSRGRWCTQIKTDLLQVLEKRHVGAIKFIGMRAAESFRRKQDFENNGVYYKNILRIIGGVSTSTVWNYLEKNIAAIGINYQRLRDYYGIEGRDGCWYCYAQRYAAPDSIEAAYMLKLRSYFGNDYPDFLRVREDHSILRTSVKYCKIWFNDLLELQEQFGRALLTDLEKKYIFEMWNARETIGETLTKRDFLNAYFSGQYVPLYPELFDLTFYQKGTQYNWIKYNIIE